LIPPARVTIASALKGQGYATGAFGKWHIGLGWKPKEGYPGDFHYGSQLHGPSAGKSIAAISRYKYSDAVEPMIQMAPWRLDLSSTGQLYNLANDPYEQKNLYPQESELVKKLTREMQNAINSGRSRPLD